MTDTSWLNMGINIKKDDVSNDRFRLKPRLPENKILPRLNTTTDVHAYEIPFKQYVGRQRFKYSGPNLPSLIIAENSSSSDRYKSRRILQRDALLGNNLFITKTQYRDI